MQGALVEENAVVEAGSVVPKGARIPAKEVEARGGAGVAVTVVL